MKIVVGWRDSTLAIERTPNPEKRDFRQLGIGQIPDSKEATCQALGAVWVKLRRRRISPFIAMLLSLTMG
jgi:hypothetical protein